MRTIVASPPPPPGGSGDHLLISVDGGPWQSTTATSPASLTLPEALLPDQLQRLDFAVYNPTSAAIGLAVTSDSPTDLEITAPTVQVEAPTSVAAQSIAVGEVTVTTPSWEGETWMGRHIETRIIIHGGIGDPVDPSQAGLARTGADPIGAGVLATALVVLGLLGWIIAASGDRLRKAAAR